MRRNRVIAVVAGAVALAVALAVVALVSGAADPGGGGAGGDSVVVVAVGDIGTCDDSFDEATARLVDMIDPDAVLTLGDNAYENGTASEYRECYGPAWGRYKEKTYPTPGNHEYHDANAEGYFDYFGDRAPAPYYSFNVGHWHVVSLNSEIEREKGSEQERWLRADLERDDHRCELLYWHKPRWSGGNYESDESMQALWKAAYDMKVDLVLNAHDHNYQRFFRQDAQGNRDGARGVVAFVVGTGGRSEYELRDVDNRAAGQSGTYGVLQLTLHETSYDFEFVPVAGGSFEDSGEGKECR